MSGLLDFMSGRFAADLVCALLHTLWQALVIAGLLYVFLKHTAARNTNLRYGAGVASLVLVVICGLVTWAVLDFAPAAAPVKTSGSQIAVPAAGDSVSRNETSVAVPANHERAVLPAAGSTESARASWQATAMFVWLTGVVVMLCRTAWTVLGVSRLRRSCRPLEDARILGIVEELKETMRIAKRISLAVTDRVISPGVIGLVQPTLLLPISMMTGMDIEDIKAVLAHELAHIKRYDCLVNFCQMVVEAILFFNPALWWVSRQIRIEREACCDAAGVAITGRRAKYAEVLYEWAQRLSSQSPTGAAAMVGFGNDADKGRMLDRMQRIVVKGHRPRVRISWYMTIAMLAALSVVLIGLWQGTNATVKFAGRLLTPQERIEKMKEIAKTHDLDRKTYGPEDSITISGRVLMADGSDLPKDLYVRLRAQRPRHGYSSSISPTNGTFSTSLEYFNELILVVRVEGFAPAFAGPFEPEPGDAINDIELVLDKGFEGQIKIVDSAGQPIKGALVKGHYILIEKGSYSNANSLDEMITDADGVATVAYCSDRPLAVYVTADGYQMVEREDIRIWPRRPPVVELKNSKPTSGIVVSKQTGEPIADAAIRLTRKTRLNHTWGYDDSGPIFTRTDSEGKFVLSSLRDDWKYHFFVEADGFNKGILSGVDMGQKDMKVQLGPEIEIKATITVPLESLRISSGKPQISRGCEYMINGNPENQRGDVDVEVVDGVGHFVIRSPLGDKVTIRAGTKAIAVELKGDSVDDVVIDLSPEAIAENTRQVIFRFDVSQGAPPPEGRLRLNYNSQANLDAGMSMRYAVIDIDNGIARSDVEAPGRVSYGLSYQDDDRLVGYWIANSSGIDVPEGKEPFEILIPVHPAGAIYGEVLEPDGQVAENVSFQLVTVVKPDFVKYIGTLNSTIGRNTKDIASFNASPLPFGGTYAIVAYRDNCAVASEAIELTEAEPMKEINLQFPEGVTVNGTVFGPDGGPFVGANVSLQCNVQLAESSHFNRTFKEMATDEEGQFAFEHVNPDLDGKYVLQVQFDHDYQPVKMQIKPKKRTLKIKLRKGHAIAGRVIDDKTGWPIPGLRVFAEAVKKDGSGSDVVGAEADTDMDGRFRFSNMARKQYRLYSGYTSIKGNLNARTVTGDQEGEITLRVDLYEWSKLKPQKPQENE